MKGYPFPYQLMPSAWPTVAERDELGDLLWIGLPGDLSVTTEQVHKELEACAFVPVATRMRVRWVGKAELLTEEHDRAIRRWKRGQRKVPQSLYEWSIREGYA